MSERPPTGEASSVSPSICDISISQTCDGRDSIAIPADISLRTLVVILGIAFVAFELTNVPRALHYDLCSFMASAREMGEGTMPYRDRLNFNYPGAFLLHYFVIEAFGNNHWGIRVFDGILLMCTGICLYGLMRPAVKRGVVLLIALLWLFIYAYSGLESSQAERDPMMIPFLLAGLWAARVSVFRPWAALGMGMGIGAAIWVKPAFVFIGVLGECVVLGQLLLGGRENRWRHIRRQLCWAVIGTLLVSLPIVIWLLSVTTFEALWAQLAVASVDYAGAMQMDAAALAEQFGKFFWRLGMVSLLIPAGIWTMLRRPNFQKFWPVAVLLIGGTLSLSVQHGYFYQALPMVFSLILIVGIGANRLLTFERSSDRWVIVLVPIWLAVSVIVTILHNRGYVAGKHFLLDSHLLAPVVFGAAVWLVYIVCKCLRSSRLSGRWLAILLIGWPAAALFGVVAGDIHTLYSKGLHGFRQYHAKGYRDLQVGYAIRDATEPTDRMVIVGAQFFVYWAAERISSVRDYYAYFVVVTDPGDQKTRWEKEYSEQMLARPPVVVVVERDARQDPIRLWPRWPKDHLQFLLDLPVMREWFDANYTSIGDYFTRGGFSRKITVFVKSDRPEVAQRLRSDPRMQIAAESLIQYCRDTGRPGG